MSKATGGRRTVPEGPLMKKARISFSVGNFTSRLGLLGVFACLEDRNRLPSFFGTPRTSLIVCWRVSESTHAPRSHTTHHHKWISTCQMYAISPNNSQKHGSRLVW